MKKIKKMETYGFIFWILSFLLFFGYIVWIFLPSALLEDHIAFSFLPSVQWALLLPTVLCWTVFVTEFELTGYIWWSIPPSTSLQWLPPIHQRPIT